MRQFTETEKTVLLKNSYELETDPVRAVRHGIQYDMSSVVPEDSGYSCIYDSETGNYLKKFFEDLGEGLKWLDEV